MKNLRDTIVNESTTNILSGESTFYKNDLEKTFRSLIDDAAYNLSRDFNIKKTPAEISEIVIKAMEKYKNFK